MIGRHEEAEEPRILQRPRKGKAVAQHKMRQQSKGQTARNRLAKEREQKCPVPGQPRTDHREWRQKGGKSQSITAPKGKEKPTSSIGRCGGLGRSTAELAPWAPSTGWARAPARPKRWLLTEPRTAVPMTEAGGVRRRKGQARGKLPGHAPGFPSRREPGSQVWQCPGFGNAGAGL